MKLHPVIERWVFDCISGVKHVRKDWLKENLEISEEEFEELFGHLDTDIGPAGHVRYHQPDVLIILQDVLGPDTASTRLEWMD